MTETATEPAAAFEAQVPLSEPVIADADADAAPTSAKKQQKAPFQLTAALASAPSSVDAFVHHLHRCLRTRGGTDTVLLFSAYAARLAGAVLAILGRATLRQNARKLVELAFQLPPSTSVSLKGATASPLATLALGLSKRLEAFVGMLGEWRTMNRLWGIMAMWLAAKDLLLRLRQPASAETDEKAPKSSKFNTTVEVLQVISLTAYHIGEATAWFSGKGVVKLSAKTRGRFATVSVRSWGAYVFMELTRLLVERRRRTVSEDAKVEKEYKDDWFTKFTHTAAWAPLTIHWGYGDGFLPDIAVAALATYPSAALMKDLWRSTA
ncbi:hypothetical protein B0J13DRAFT_47502 [Dactylonectria estremocensis]|uniref:Peroxin 11C n=1 Tax=Dactylonectria estremocensis TaxID=1079267 RepID=A0A9P9EQQ5_9HYPO|nr:hypothetical protein B0J13DRAFT_47502 [Dactylonectria estremocensis]